MPVLTFNDEERPDEAAAVGAILEMLDGAPLQFGVDVLLTSLSCVIGGVLAEAESPVEGLEGRIARMVDNYAEMLKLTILTEVGRARGSAS